MNRLEEILHKGQSAAAAGQFEEAAASYLAFLNELPHVSQAWSELGAALVRLHREEDAVECFRNALSLAPECTDFFSHLAQTLFALKRWKDVESLARDTLSMSPNHCLAHHFLGCARQVQGELAQAEESFRAALQIDPGFAPARINLGVVLKDLGKTQEALRFHQELLLKQPHAAEGYNNLANIYGSQGNSEKAFELLEKAVEIDPRNPQANFNLGCLLLREGRFEEGWRRYEFRRQCGIVSQVVPGRPFWDGTSLEGKTILLLGEQGYGDNIMAVRYAPKVKEKGGRVFLRCKRALRDLFVEVEGVDRVFSDEEEIPGIDVQCFLMSLPGIFQTRAETIPSKTPYLRASSAKMQRFRALMGEGPRKVGLCWQGNSGHVNDKNRSISPERFSMLPRLSSMRFFGLQVPVAGKHVELLEQSLGLFDLSPQLQSFADTAAAIENLDLVITVDTAVAHLAGALGKPTWLLLPKNGEWRWMEGDATPWYPSMRLFRQASLGDWKSVLTRVSDRLRDFEQSTDEDEKLRELR